MLKKAIAYSLAKFYSCGQVCYAGAALTVEKVADFILKLTGVL